MKRIFDFFMSTMLLVILSPLMIIISVIIKVTSKGNIFFKQKRIGRLNEEFYIYKFRTMRIDTPDVATHLLENPEEYITSIGKFLRRTSLDELPQLFNILKGEMTFVGPRPALYNQYDLKEMRNKNGIHILVPGLTGWAQINGRDEISLEEKVRFDKEYLENQGFRLDFKILILTILTVVKKDGIKEGLN